jgi:hypothetical protein
LPDAATEIFLREGLDRLLVICPSCQFVAAFVLARLVESTNSEPAGLAAGSPFGVLTSTVTLRLTHCEDA